ncbi:MAG: hypothetical protein K2R98_14110 [Gemmataceae bacterium]|nr:hypothetical protein [Gemmataceae bacterium]
MDFRWVAAITLWTMISGPILAHLQTIVPPTRTSAVSATSTAAPAQGTRVYSRR